MCFMGNISKWFFCLLFLENIKHCSYDDWMFRLFFRISRYSDDMIFLFVKKNAVKADNRDTTFGLQFVISHGRRKNIPQLEWKKYSVRSSQFSELNSKLSLNITDEMLFSWFSTDHPKRSRRRRKLFRFWSNANGISTTGFLPRQKLWRSIISMPMSHIELYTLNNM